MSLTNADKVEEHTQLRASAAAKVATFVPMAEGRLRALIGDDSYEAIENDPQHAHRDELTRAESYMCMYFGLQFLNLRPTELGGFSKTVGYGESATETLMGERELRAIRGRIYEMAIELLDDIRDIVPEDPDKFEQTGPDSFDAGAFTIA